MTAYQATGTAGRIWLFFCVHANLCPACKRRLRSFEPKGFVDREHTDAVRFGCPSCGNVFSDELLASFRSRHWYPDPIFCDRCGFSGWESQGLQPSVDGPRYVIVCRNCQHRDVVAADSQREVPRDSRVGFLCPGCGIGPVRFIGEEYDYSELGSRCWHYYKDYYRCQNCGLEQAAPGRKEQS